jgi:hypothetical protein
MAYPVDVRTNYGDGRRSRGLAVLGILYGLKYLLLIPHAIALFFVGIGTFIAIWIGYWAILFTGRQPDGIDRFVAGAIRWSIRINAWFLSLSDAYPAFGFDDGPEDSQTTVDVDEGDRNRLLGASGIVGIKFLLAIPHIVVLYILQFAAFVAGWVGFWIILFTGKQPQGLHDFIVGTLRWNARVGGWIGSVTDEYPPFAFD